MRVGIIGLQHESNTFIAKPTTLEDFKHDRLLVGEQVRQEMAAAHNEIGGFLQALSEEKIDAVPLMFTGATPGGPVSDETLDALLKIMWEQLDGAGKLDGLLVAPHGAGVGQTHRDLDGYWLTLLRQRVGPDMPIMITLDLHANLTPRMVAACNATIGYRMNPHLDQRQRGVDAGRLMARTLRGEIKPTQAAAFPPIAINIERQLTAASPCRELYAFADAQLTRPGVLSNTVLLGFPYSDVEELGTTFVAVTDNDAALAQALADEMARYLWDRRQDFVGHLISIDEALDQAAKAPGPVCLLDMGDNVGGGAAADGTTIAHAIHQRKGPRAFVALYDPESARQASDAGVGARLRLRMGGKSDDRHGPPLEAHVTVVSLHDGKYTETQARHGGRGSFDMGETAIVETDHGLTIQLNSYRAVPVSLNQILSCGIDPKRYQILIAKGVHAPVAAYAPVCPTLIRVNTIGVTTADMNRLTYHHRRRPLFPFEDVPRP